MSGLRLRPLDWLYSGPWLVADSIVGRYWAQAPHDGASWLLCLNGEVLTRHPDEAAMKAAAQAHYEARILECFDEGSA